MDGIPSDRSRRRTNNSWVINQVKSLLIEAIRSVSEWVSECVIIQFTCVVCLCICKGMMQEFYPLEDSPKFCSLIWGTNLTSNYQWNEVNMRISLFNMHFIWEYMRLNVDGCDVTSILQSIKKTFLSFSYIFDHHQ